MSEIINNGRIQGDEWRVLPLAESDDVATVVVPTGRVTVPLTVWQVQRSQRRPASKQACSGSG